MTADNLSLEERVQLLEDHQAIARLFRDYRRYLDGKDFSSYAELFTEDGEFGSSRAQGPAAIQELVEGMVGTGLRERKGDDLHLVANEVVEIDGDRATTDVTWVYIVRDDSGGPSLCKVGHYNDILIRRDGRWKFQRRAGGMDMAAEVEL